MSIPEEHDYIGLSEPCSMEKSSDKMSSPSSSSNVPIESEKNGVVNLKETELRLGLPGSDFLERKSGTGISLFGKELKDEGYNGFSQIPLKNLVSGAKRGFSDAIDGDGKWGLGMKGGSEVELGKLDDLFSPRGGNCGSENTNGLQSCLQGTSLKEVGKSSVLPVKPVGEKKSEHNSTAPASKAQVVGWPPIRSFRKNTIANNLSKTNGVTEKPGLGCLYVKVSMDGAPYLRKVDLKTCCSYAELSYELEKMFSYFTIGQYGHAGQEHLKENCFKDLLHGSEYVLTYEDKDGDCMLVGDVPWEMFTDSCKRLRIVKGSEATGLAPRAMQKCKSKN